MRIVVDASALGEFLLGAGANDRIEAVMLSPGAELHVPELADIEFVSLLRNALAADELSESRLEEALADYLALPLFRHRHRPLIGRVLDLRHNFSAYDAVYAALAELLEAPLLTADASLARAARRHLDLTVLP